MKEGDKVRLISPPDWEHNRNKIVFVPPIGWEGLIEKEVYGGSLYTIDNWLPTNANDPSTYLFLKSRFEKI